MELLERNDVEIGSRFNKSANEAGMQGDDATGCASPRSPPPLSLPPSPRLISSFQAPGGARREHRDAPCAQGCSGSCLPVTIPPQNWGRSLSPSPSLLSTASAAFGRALQTPKRAASSALHQLLPLPWHQEPHAKDPTSPLGALLHDTPKTLIAFSFLASCFGFWGCFGARRQRGGGSFVLPC